MILAIAAVVLAALTLLYPTLSSWRRLLPVGRRETETRAALPALIDALAAALRGGLSLPLAFSEVAPTTPMRLASPTRRVAASLWLGVSCAQALAEYAPVLPAKDLAPVALVLSSFERSGGHVVSSLERVAGLLRGRLALEQERLALTAQSRASALVLVSLAPLGVVFFLAAMPDYGAIFVHDGLGLAALALVFEAVGGAWLWRIVRSTDRPYDLASFLDAVVVGLDAGLTFERALTELVSRVPDLPRREDACRLLADLRLGESLASSLQRFARDPDELRVAALVSASARFGAPLAHLLVVQANAIRETERHRAEASARRLPVVMLFPLATCILPALLIVFLGPPLLSLLH